MASSSSRRYSSAAPSIASVVVSHPIGVLLVPLRYTLTLTPSDVGARVVVRRVLPGGGIGDVLGLLERWADGSLAIRRRDGTLTTVAETDLVAAKVVPAAPVRRRSRQTPDLEPASSPVELQEIAARSSRAIDTAWLGRWWLRASEGFTHRANAVIPAGEAGVDLERSLDHVQRWYSGRHLPALIQVVDGSALDDELAARGWTTRAAALTLSGRLDEALAALGAGEAAAVQEGGEPTDSWLQRYRPDGFPPAARQVLGGGPGVAFASVTAPGSDVPVAIGRAVVEGPWVGIAAVAVAQEERRRGHARAVMRALLRFGIKRGASRAYLQVVPDNAAARALYEQLGFTLHHRYHYRSAP